VPWFNKAIEVLCGRLNKEPEDVEARRSLRDARAGRVRALSRLGHHADAVKECEEALAIDTALPRDSTHALRALTLGRQGQWAGALAEADKVSTSQKLSGTGLYDLACTYALNAAAEGGRPAEAQAARAVEMLGRARKAGFFDGATFVEKLKKDADLDPLRKRPEFQKLLAEVEKKPAGP
jgi:tetratricopeptide (TPR) repeat protein